jgi:WD40 repeat protein
MKSAVACAVVSDKLIAVGDCFGRVLTTYLSDMPHPPPQCPEPYTFHGGKQTADNQVFQLYQVNALASHPRTNALAVGFGDGRVCTYDLSTKLQLVPPKEKKIVPGVSYTIFPTGPAPVTTMGFDCTGNILAVAYGDDYAKGPAAAKVAPQLMLYPLQPFHYTTP